MIWKIPLEIKNNIEKKKHQLGQITKKIKELFRAQEMLMSKYIIIFIYKGVDY